MLPTSSEEGAAAVAFPGGISSRPYQRARRGFRPYSYRRDASSSLIAKALKKKQLRSHSHHLI